MLGKLQGRTVSVHVGSQHIVPMPSSGFPQHRGQSSHAVIADVKGLVHDSWIALLHVHAKCGNVRKRDRPDAVTSVIIAQPPPSDQA